MKKWSKRAFALSTLTLVAAAGLFVGQQLTSADSSDARGPAVTARFEVSRGVPTRLPTLGVGCSEVDGNNDGLPDSEPDEFYDDSAQGEYGNFNWYIHAKCIADDYTGLDPSGPSVVPIQAEFTSIVSGLPTGWGICEDQVAIESFQVHQQIGLITVRQTMEQFGEKGFVFDTGDGGPVGPNAVIEVYSGYSYVGNAARPEFLPSALVCGPDATSPSGMGWKYLQGKPIKLPALSKWPRS